MTRRQGGMSGFASRTNSASLQGFRGAAYGHSYPGHYPGDGEPGTNLLGTPLTIREVAELIGCSDWTVRQRWLPQGLPHLRSGPTGKLIFYESQVIRWLLEQQQKGGTY
jgi:hypothetical protein